MLAVYGFPAGPVWARATIPIWIRTAQTGMREPDSGARTIVATGNIFIPHPGAKKRRIKTGPIARHCAVLEITAQEK
ncbi:MAG: hypothetical protein LBO79_09255 [Zoogloeaceae bacterium]|nr:hypothetical protein [Zoogloeaceae bacterium]